jgi:NhaC family Na+:H+ antiporter
MGGLRLTTDDPQSEAVRRQGRASSVVDALIPVVALLILLISSFLLFGDAASYGPNQIALLTCGLIAIAVAMKNKLSWEHLRAAALEGVASGLPAIFILLAVGALIGTWAMSGTIVAMVYYGMEILNPQYFYASAALLCAVVAFSIGSSWTTAGTLGIGLMGVAANMGLSPAITAGAVISGAYFGDKGSPLSDTVNLATAATGSELYQLVQEGFWTSIPTLLLSLIFFALLGSSGNTDVSGTLSSLDQHFNISLWSFLPLVFVLALAMLRVSPFITIFLGALIGGVFAVIMNPQAVVALAADPSLPTPIALLKGVWSALANGHRIDTGEPKIDTLLSRGGMASMLPTVWLIITALAFGALVERAGLLDRLVQPILSLAHTTGRLVTAVAASCVVTNIVAADQYIAVVLPGRMFRREFEQRGYAPVVLSRALIDTAPVTSALIPWNSCGAYMAATLGVATLSYAPFAFLCLLSPLATIAIAGLGIRMVRSAHVEAP